MCSVGGFIVHEFNLANASRIQRILSRFDSLILEGTERGRDAWGSVLLWKDGEAFHKLVSKGIGCATSEELENKMWKGIREFLTTSPKAKLVAGIFNNRAEPTTEWIKEKTLETVQPFSFGDIDLAHNGTIANDKDLYATLGLPVGSVDSQVLPRVLQSNWSPNAHRHLGELWNLFTNTVKGSFAITFLHKADPEALYVGTNYKPLFLIRDRQLDTTFVTSIPHTYSIFSERSAAEQVSPYSWMRLTAKREVESCDLWTEESLLPCTQEDLMSLKPRPVVVICSGGLDSVTAATLYVKDSRRIFNVHLFHALYKCNAETSEISAIERVANTLGVPYVTACVPFFKEWGHSPILDDNVTDYSHRNAGESGAEFAFEWVPARNLVLYAMGLAYLETLGGGELISGINLEEAGAYPDNEQAFIRALRKVVPFAVRAYINIRLQLPVANLMKHEIVKLGIGLDAPLQHTWSCYNSAKQHCGSCGPCYMRQRAFAMNHAIDPVDYKFVPEGLWKDCETWVVAQKRIVVSKDFQELLAMVRLQCQMQSYPLEVFGRALTQSIPTVQQE